MKLVVYHMIDSDLLLLFMSVVGMDYADPKRKGNIVGKLIVAAGLIAFCLIMVKQSPTFSSPSQVSLVQWRI